METTTKLREMMKRGEQVIAPGIYDPLSAKAAVSLGFNGVYLGGFASSAPIGTMEPLMTMTEQVERARGVAKVIGDVPLIVDGHTGYGEAVHITRAVREFEDAGVAGIHIEDQFFPKRASYHKGLKHMVSIEEMQERIQAALRARRDPDFVIIARTEARGAAETKSLEETIRRLKAYAEAGADVLMPMPYGREEGARVHEAIPDVPLMWFAGLGPFAPGEEVPLDELKRIGYQIVAFPVIGLVRAIDAVVATYTHVKEHGVVDVTGLEEGYERIMELIEAPAFYEIEATTTERAAARA